MIIRGRTILFKSAGFTLIEVLVVLVIVSLVTTILSSGLATTWNNFSRLDSRTAQSNALILVSGWFRESVAHAVLEHPEIINFSGDLSSISFRTTRPPSVKMNHPSRMVWRIIEIDGRSQLGFESGLESDLTVIFTTDEPLSFEYLSDGKWSEYFFPENALLPDAVRIVKNGEGFIYASPSGPITPYVPPELALFGEYEF